ncbi:thiosulfate oxidation carrier complex protein SoxZ [Sedimenticola sp.]|uniref:thiosulfate oxidation carrier complex protein SoxZ n=1 Tax=Sedimenticola sp. TaxID=1940285 RepID=UPI003D0AEC73
MSGSTKMRLRMTGRHCEVLALIRHPMSRQAKGDPEPNCLIQMTFELNGQPVAEAYLGPGVAVNPLTSIVLDGTRPGDRITVHWVDSQGRSDVVSARVS